MSSSESIYRPIPMGTVDLSTFPVFKSFLAGAFSAACSTALFQPLDLVKTRLQTPVKSTSCSNGLLSAFGNIVRQDRIPGLWRGMTPSMARCVPGVGLYFAALEYLTIHLVDGTPTASNAMFLGVVARCIAGVSLLPFSVIKTRFESGVYQYGGVLGALNKIYITEGTRGLYSGMTATLVRDAPFSGMYLMIYTQLKQLLPDTWKSNQFAPLAYFSCGIVAGSFASCITQPADVIKTHMQLYPNRFSRTGVTIIHIYKSSGPSGYFRGLVPRLMRRTLVSAMSWTVYEQLMKRMGLK